MSWNLGLSWSKKRASAAVPVLLWDTRHWAGGSFSLVNEGSAGSSYSLAKAQTTLNNGNVRQQAFNKPSTPILVSELGGSICDSPVTMMAVLSLPPIDWAGGFTNQAVGSQVDANLFGYSWFSVTGGGDGMSFYVLGQEAPDGGGDQYITMNFGASEGSLQYNTTESQGSLALFVLKYDSSGMTGEVYVNGVLVTPSLYSPGFPCTDDDISDPVNLLVDTFCSLTRPAAPSLGPYWYGVGAVAMFRGDMSDADLAYWQEYFCPFGQAVHPAPLLFSVEGSQTNSSVIESFTVPSRTIPITGLQISVRSACGYNGAWQRASSFTMSATAGDVIEIHAGAGGHGPNHSVPGAGGWPDGGDGGLNTHAAYRTNKYGGGGGGSTKIYKNGVLQAQIAGSGGGRVSFNSGGTISTGASAADAGAAAPTINNSSVNGISVVASDGGGGATGSSGGAAGSGSLGSGTAGSFGAGGDGATFSAGIKPSSVANLVSSGGGGGGGGYYGGGGGGASTTVIGGDAHGGGSGSNYFGPAVTSRPIAASSAAAGSWVDVRPAYVTVQEIT